MNESIGNAKHFQTDQILTSHDVDTMLKTMSENQVIEWLNENFVGLMRIFPTYDMYYINVLNWTIVNKKLTIYYESYWDGSKFTELRNMDNLLLKEFNYAVKIGEKKGKKNPKIDPFEEEFWEEED